MLFTHHFLLIFHHTGQTDKRNFMRCYRNSAVMLGADQIEKVKITAQPEKVVMRLMFKGENTFVPSSPFCYRNY